MKTTFKHLSLVITAIFIGQILNAQVAMPTPPEERDDILSSFALKISEEPNLNLGKIGINVPLYEYVDDEFRFPISLSYASGGYKTNDFISYVGLGWTLNAGGTITKSVNGIEDSKGSGFGLGGFYGLYNGSEVGRNYESLFRNGGIIELDHPMNIYHAYDYYFLKNSVRVETTPDRFDFQFLNYSGSFYIGIDTTYVITSSFPHGELKITTEMSKDYIGGTKSDSYGRKFTITSGNGDQYIFLPHLYENRTGLHAVRATVRPFTNKAPNSVWLLKEIRRKYGPKITFEYNKAERYVSATPYSLDRFAWDENEYIGSSRPIPPVLKTLNNDQSLSAGGGGDPSSLPPGMRKGILNKEIYYYPINRIILDDFVTISFDYEERLEEIINSTKTNDPTIGDVPYVKRIKSVTVKHSEGAANATHKKYNFKYSYSNMPETWGYTARPVFFLKEITTAEGETYNFDYYGEDKFFPPIGHSIDHWGFYNNGGVASPLPHSMDVDKNNIESTGAENERGHGSEFSGALLGMLKRVVYPTKGATHFYYEPHTIDYTVTKTNYSANKQNLLWDIKKINVGGVRIKKITDYSTPNDSTYRRYEYEKYDPYEGDVLQTGILQHTPRYSRKKSKNIMSSTELDYTMHGNFIFTEDASHIAYSKVYEYFPDNSYKEYHFSDHFSIPDSPHNDQLIKFSSNYKQKEELWDNFYAKPDSRHLDRGKLIGLYYYTPDNKLTYSKENTYDYSKALPYFGSAGKTFTYYYLQKHFVQASPLIKTTETTYSSADNSGVNKVINTTEYSYNRLGQKISEKKRKSDGSFITDSWQYISDLPAAKMNSINRGMLNQNMVNSLIKTQTRKSSSGIVSGKHFNYQDYSYKINQIKSIETTTPLISLNFDFDNFLATDVNFKRGTSGRIVEATDRGGFKIAYIWSDEGKLLAEVKNRSIDQVNTILGTTSVGLGLNDTMKDKLYEIKDAHVTVFDYKPLIGIISLTTPSRITTYYEYDDFGRIKRILKDGNSGKDPITEYDYFFKGSTFSWDRFSE